MLRLRLIFLLTDNRKRDNREADDLASGLDAMELGDIGDEDEIKDDGKEVEDALDETLMEMEMEEQLGRIRL